MHISHIENFKKCYRSFSDALRYIVQNEPKLKTDPERWNKIKQNFFEKFERPLDLSWLSLSKEERKSLSSVYLHRKAQTDPTIQKIVKTFNAKIINVSEEE